MKRMRNAGVASRLVYFWKKRERKRDPNCTPDTAPYDKHTRSFVFAYNTEIFGYFGRENKTSGVPSADPTCQSTFGWTSINIRIAGRGTSFGGESRASSRASCRRPATEGKA